MSLVLIAVILFLLISCSTVPSAHPQSYIIQITSVVDHVTGEPLRTNTIWVTIERGKDGTVEFTDNNISDFSIEMSVGEEAYILVEAPCYEDWEILVDADNAKYEELVVELIPITDRANIVCLLGNTFLYS